METPNSHFFRNKGLRVGKTVQRLREEQELTMDFVAKELGLDVHAYSMIEADQSTINDELLQQLSKALKVSITDLLSAQETIQFSNYGTAQEQSFSAHYHHGEMERLERLYREQINLLRDEVSYLRTMLQSVANKD